MNSLMTEEYKQYLDELRDSGETNMYAAPRYLQAEFGVSRREAQQIFIEWTKTFDEED